MSKKIKDSFEFLHKNKKGSKENFIKEYNEDIFNQLLKIGFISLFKNEKNEIQWKLTKEGYDLIVVVCGLRYKSIFTKIQDYLEYIFYFKWQAKEFKKQEEIKQKYFEN